MSKRPWSSRSPKDICKGLHFLLTWSNGFCVGRGKEGALVEKDRGEDKMKTRELSDFTFFVQNCHFWVYIKKSHIFLFLLVLVIPLGPHSVYI